jgi:hypothetical protein
MVTVVSGPEQLLFAAPKVRAESAPRSHRGELSGELGGKTPGGRRRLRVERDRHGDHQPRLAPEASDS